MPSDAAWCTLCFARLRQEAAAPAPSAPETSVPTSAPAPRASEPFAAPLAPAVTAPVLSAPVLSAPVPAPVPSQSMAPAPVPPVPVTAPVATAVVESPVPTWPCSGCSTRVPLEETVCPSCGTAFLGGVNPNVSLKLPGVGDVVGLSTGAKFGLMAGGAFVLTATIVLLLLILGHIF